MKLFLIQHAKALSKEVDPDRPLSAEGRAELRKTSQFLSRLNLSVDYIWHSQKTRAAQTARILSDAVNVKNQITALPGLGPNDDVDAIKDKISAADADIMIIGHLPFLPKLASLLLTGRQSANILNFKNAGVVALSCHEKSHWQLDWLLTPQILAENYGP